MQITGFLTTRLKYLSDYIKSASLTDADAVLVVIFFIFSELLFFTDVAICDLMHNKDTMHGQDAYC